jgi:hypothetical protein
MDSQPGMCQHGHSSHPLPVAHLQSPADTQQGHLLQSPTAQIALDQQWLVSKAAILVNDLGVLRNSEIRFVAQPAGATILIDVAVLPNAEIDSVRRPR